MMDSTLHYTSVSHSGALMATINKMRVNSDLCDVTVVVGDYRVMAHRIILSASAPFFYQMLQLESQSPHHDNNNEVQLNNIDEIAALKIIEFCYTSAISLDDDTVWPLLAASIKFQLPEICSFCCEFLVAGLDASNCVLSLRLAAKVHCPQLEENCVKFLLDNLDQACISHGLTSLSTPELCSLLSVLALHDVSPATVAKLVRVWMDSDKVTRQLGVVLQLLQMFPSLAPYLHQFTQRNEPTNPKHGRNTAESDVQMKRTTDSNVIDGNLLSPTQTRTVDALQERSTTRTVYGNIADNGRELQHQEKTEMMGGKSQSGFGMGASREFICISCGDDFDCQEDLMSHQDECGESARMVGSGGGDSLKEGLRGRSDEGKGTAIALISRKRKMIEESDIDCGNGKNVEVTIGSQSEILLNNNSVGSNNSDGPVSEMSESRIGGCKSNDCLDQDLDRGEIKAGDSLSSVSMRPGESIDADECKTGRNGDGHRSCVSDDNNNAIHRQGRGVQGNGTVDQHANDDDPKLNGVLGSRDTSASSSFPDILTSAQSVHSMESHFKTKNLIGTQGWPGKHSYSSSSLGMASPTVVAVSSSSSSSSFQHLRPQQRCQICGRSFWEWKQLSQHWGLDHGIKTTRVVAMEDGVDDADSLPSTPSPHRLLKPKSSKLSLAKELAADTVSFPTNSWSFASNYPGHDSMANSLSKPGSAFRDIQKNSLEDTGGKLSGQDSSSRKSHGDADNKRSMDGEENHTEAVNDQRQDGMDRLGALDKINPDNHVQSRSPIGEQVKDHFQDARDSPSSFVKQEQQQKEVDSKKSDDLKSSPLLAAGNFVLPGSQGMVSGDFISNYLSQYNKLAQWCLAQGPNFCLSCLGYHSNCSPCPRPQTNSLLGKHHQKPLSSPTAEDVSAIKEETIGEENDEDKEVNVDGVDEDMDEGPLDMSKSSSLDFSNHNNLSSTSTSSTASTTNQFTSPPAGRPHSHSRPSSASSSVTMPPYYGYGHFLSGSSILDMSAAIKAAGGNFNDLMPRQSPVQDLITGSRPGESGREQQHPHFNSYLHHHVLSASAIAAQSSMANNSNLSINNGSLVPTAFTAMGRPHNGLTASGAGLVSSHDISSASSPSSIFSFPSSPPNPNVASASASTSTSSHLPPPTTSGGKKKSATVPPKQGFPCTVCSRVYSHQSALFTHMRSHSPSTRSYRCQFCNETFARAPDLKVHVCPNGIEKPFSCSSCGQTFAKNIHLKRHLATHSGLKPYPCWVCGKRFSRSDHLKRHTQSIHAGARPHACHICGKEFVRKYELNKHMASHN